MLSAILFILYFVALLMVLTAWAKKTQIGISPGLIAIIYAYKGLFGCLYGYIFLKFYQGDDTWMYYLESLPEYQKLIHHPVNFLTDFLPYSAFSASHNFWEGMQFYIQDLEYWMMIKLLALFNIFSRGNYYINVLFFDFVTFTGLLLLYKLVVGIFNQKKIMLIAILFFLPLTTFWLSGIRAEGLLLLFIAIILYYTHKWFNGPKKVVYLMFIMLGITGCIIFRSQLLIVFVPAFFCMTISWRNTASSIYNFCAVYFTCIAIFFISIFISPGKNLSMAVIKRQQEFFKLHGTSFKLDSLQPSAASFIKIAPQAFSNTFLRPFVWEAKGFLQLLTALDIFFIWALLLIAFFFHERKWKKSLQSPLLLLFLFFSISQIILIGYIVPFPGAIVRYKCVPELLLFIFIASIIDYHRIFIFFKKKK